MRSTRATIAAIGSAITESLAGSIGNDCCAGSMTSSKCQCITLNAFALSTLVKSRCKLVADHAVCDALHGFAWTIRVATSMQWSLQAAQHTMQRR